MKTKIWILVVMAVVFVTLAALSFTRQTPSSEAPIDRETFVQVYVELSITGEKIGIGTPEYEDARDSIMNAFGVSVDGFNKFQEIYDEQPEQWAEVWDQILAELEGRKSALNTTDSSAIN